MLIFSHRGYHANTPANTYEAFAQAVALGADLGHLKLMRRAQMDNSSYSMIAASRQMDVRSDISLIVNSHLASGLRSTVPLEQALQQWRDIWWEPRDQNPGGAGANP